MRRKHFRPRTRGPSYFLRPHRLTACVALRVQPIGVPGHGCVRSHAGWHGLRRGRQWKNDHCDPTSTKSPSQRVRRFVQEWKPVTTSPTPAPINPMVRAAAPAQSSAIARFGRLGLPPITDTKNPVGMRTAATRMPSEIAG